MWCECQVWREIRPCQLSRFGYKAWCQSRSALATKCCTEKTPANLATICYYLLLHVSSGDVGLCKTKSTNCQSGGRSIVDWHGFTKLHFDLFWPFVIAKPSHVFVCRCLHQLRKLRCPASRDRSFHSDPTWGTWNICEHMGTSVNLW